MIYWMACSYFVSSMLSEWFFIKWAPYDKTNKMTCAPSKDSVQPGHPLSLTRVFTVCMKEHWALGYPLCAQWRLIRLDGCPGWSESLLGTQVILLVLSCGDSNLLLHYLYGKYWYILKNVILLQFLKSYCFKLLMCFIRCFVYKVTSYE